MHCFKTITLSLLLLLLASTLSHSQSTNLAREERELARLYRKLSDGSETAYTYANEFARRLEALLKANPATIGYPFTQLTDSNYCYIKTSADGLFRIYTWDTWGGGTMHFFKEIRQWKGNGHVQAILQDYGEGDAGVFCSRIFTVPVRGKNHYLAVMNGIYSTKDASQSVQAFSIDHGRLNDTVKLFQTKTKTLNTISVPFNFFSVADRPERPLELITYDARQQKLCIPLVKTDGQVTDRRLVYRIKGDYFVYTGTEQVKP